MPDIMQRRTAFKLRIGDIELGKPILSDERFNFLELGDRKIVRVNIVANIIEKFESEGEKKYLSLTIDDASGQIRIKAFGDDVQKFKNFNQGDTVMIIGMLRWFSNELYILPEIIKSKDPRYLLVRKLELELEKPKEVDKQEVKVIKDKILDMIKESEDNGGIETEKIVMDVQADPKIVSQEIQKLLEEGLAYEPRPGKIRYLG